MLKQILVKQLQATIISVGFRFLRFGYQRQGTADDLKNIATSFGIEVCLNSLRKCQNENQQAVRVSSSLIRQALAEGKVRTANSMLSRPYSLIGTVVTGQQLGRTIGFPTANLKLPPEKFLPRYGVYAVDVLLNQKIIKGVMNIGCRPTVCRRSANY